MSKDRTKVFTLEEVKEHCTEKDCWIVIHNKVYDVSSFLAEHPGGDCVILENAGGYATEAFEDVGHSDGARRQMENYLIGVVDDKDKESKFKFSSNYSRDRQASFAGWTGALLPIAVAAVTVTAYWYLK